MVPPLFVNHPAVFVSNPLKYGPGGASAPTHTTARSAIAKTMAARRLSFWKRNGFAAVPRCVMGAVSLTAVACIRQGIRGPRRRSNKFAMPIVEVALVLT
jgi:hypothetical protein